MKLVKDREPFRFGPGKRIWSEEAILVVTKWGGQVVVVRFSIVEKDVPFLISKFVMKRLGSLVDMEENRLVFRRLKDATEPIHDLPSGHVGPELVKEDEEPPCVKDQTMQLCENGDEVAVDSDEFQKKHHPVNFTKTAHATFIPKIKRGFSKVSKCPKCRNPCRKGPTR